MTDLRTADADRRFPRRFLLAVPGAAAVAGVTQAVAAPAGAAPLTANWKLGGNANVNTDGTNYLGTKTIAPLVFKTMPSERTGPLERMRIAADGTIGIGTPVPVARVDVRDNHPITLRAVSSFSDFDAVAVTGRSLGGGFGVQGFGRIGVQGEGTSQGVQGTSEGGSGVRGIGVTGLYGTGDNYGVYATGGTGVRGGSSEGTGVLGVTSAQAGVGVLGSGGQYGVRGSSAVTAGVRGDSANAGLWGEGGNFGVYALSTKTTGQHYGIYARTMSPAGFAGYFLGDVHVNGTLSKAAGSFRIDHPLDPARKWLAHSFVESPDMMNVYNGNVVLDDDGEAVVELPDYFTALNHDFRYQLTCIGAHAPVYVADQIRQNSFRIAGGSAGLTISWQVTGIRQDAYARAHPIVVEQDKATHERGRYFLDSEAAYLPTSAQPATVR